MRPTLSLVAVLLLSTPLIGETRPRARDLGVPFDGIPGPWNAITDVRGVLVGHETIVRGGGRLVVGEGPVRTGVTAIFPKGPDNGALVPAAWFSLNGNGELTGTAWIEESGFLDGPVLLTNTHSVGTVRDATIAWKVEHGGADADPERETGSILIVIATDAPLLPHQLKRLARRATMGLARTGSVSGDGSGDLFLAFSTAGPVWDEEAKVLRAAFRPNETLDPIFAATVQATEEAIVNAMVAAETMTGVDGHTAIGLPHDRLRAALAAHRRLDTE